MTPFRLNLFRNAIATTLFGLAAAAPAYAHAMLRGAEPAANASVVGSPRLVQLHFTEALEPKFSHFAITGAGGATHALRKATPPDTSSLAAAPTTPLAPGSYTVNWMSVAADDGHKMSGRYVFTVK